MFTNIVCIKLMIYSLPNSYIKNISGGSLTKHHNYLMSPIKAPDSDLLSQEEATITELVIYKNTNKKFINTLANQATVAASISWSQQTING